MNMGQAVNEYHEKMMRLGQATKPPLSHITVEGEVYVHKSEYDDLADALRDIAEMPVANGPGVRMRQIARAALDRQEQRDGT